MNERLLTKVMLDCVEEGRSKEEIKKIPLFKHLSDDLFEDIYGKIGKIKEEMVKGNTFKEAYEFYGRE